MQRLSHLPAPPHFTVEVVRARDREEPAFLRYISRHVRLISPDGKQSDSVIYDEVDRPALDAVVILAHFVTEEGAERTRWVVLRSAIRPPILLREESDARGFTIEEGALWELPAGLIEPEEKGAAGLRAAARRELFEETGFSVDETKLIPLGPPVLPAPGLIAERQFFFQVEVDPDKQETPPLDGSPLEEAGRLVAVPLEVALSAAREGRLSDSKTELALRRLVEELDS